jgi:hypothetical protein
LLTLLTFGLFRSPAITNFLCFSHGKTVASQR